MKTRYEHLAALINEHKPQSIIEVGVHRANRAIYMIREAMQYHPRIKYTGFDVFETLGADFQELVLNGKGMAEERIARYALDTINKEFENRLDYELIIGKTQDTLHEGVGYKADFAFIDGDHRSSAIAEDYMSVFGSRVIVFDDYYVPDAEGKTPDLNVYGANSVCDKIPGAKILPHGDPCRHGGLSHLVLVVN